MKPIYENNKYYYLVNKYYYISKISGELINKLEFKQELIFENKLESLKELLRNLEEYSLKETDEENRNIALYNIEQLKLKISNPEYSAIFKIYKQKEK